MKRYDVVINRLNHAVHFVNDVNVIHPRDCSSF